MKIRKYTRKFVVKIDGKNNFQLKNPQKVIQPCEERSRCACGSFVTETQSIMSWNFLKH